MTMSAPKSSGRQRYGVATVLSTTSGIPASRATEARPSRSATAPDGLATTSVWISFVLGRSAAAKASASVEATNVVSTWNRASVPSSRVRVPP